MLSMKDVMRRLASMVSCSMNVEEKSFVEANEFGSRRIHPVIECSRKTFPAECSLWMMWIVDDSFQLLMNRLSIEKEIERMIRTRL